MSDKTLTLIPRLSEKAYGLSQQHNLYVFQVPKFANKLTVAEAVKAQFSVSVESVNIVVQKGKPKNTAHRRRRSIVGRQSDIKKAYVTVKEGDIIPIFQAEEEKPKPSRKEK